MASKFSRKSSSHSEEDMNKVREENAYLRKTLEEVCRQKEAPSDSQNNHCFLERILALETLREKNSQQILAKDQEIASLRQLLRSDSAEVVTSLHAQLNQQRAEAQMRERLFQALKQETEELKNKLAAVSAKCQVLENTGKSGTADGHAATGNSTLMEEQLKDALEKNQQWLVYDQQRETYVKAVLAETYQLEQELRQAHKALQQKEKEEERDVEIQQCYEKLVGELEREQQKGQQLLTEHQQLRKELEEERLKSAELQQQVNILQKSLLNQHEDQSRMTVLEQQIQVSARDLEDEKRDNQHLQWQLHRVLKELRKAKDKVAILESEIKQRSKRRLHTTTSQRQAQARAVSKQDYKLFRTLFILMISFFIMWSPIFIFTFLILMNNFQVHLPITSSMFVWVLTFTMANSALNPVLYSLCQLRHKWQRLCCGTVITPGQRAVTQ